MNLSAQEILVPYKVDSLFGYSDLEGNIRIEPQFDKTRFFDRNGYGLVELNKQQALIDSFGHTIKMYSSRFPEGRSYFDYISKRGKNYLVKDGEYHFYVNEEFQVTQECPFYIGKWYGNLAETAKRENRKRVHAIVDENCELVVPYSANRTVLYTLDNKARTPMIGITQKTGIVFYDETGTPILDSLYDKVKYFHHGGQSYFVLRKGDELDILNDNLELAYENLGVWAGFDAEAFATAKRESGFSNELLAALFSLEKKIRCFVTSYDDCVCYDHKTYPAGSFKNGQLMNTEGELNKGWNTNRQIYSVADANGELRVKNEQGEYIQLSEQVDTLVWDFSIRSIIAKQEDGYTFYNTDGERLNDFIAEEYNDWKISRRGHPKYAYHDRDGIPLTGFDYVDIDRTSRRSRFLAKTPQGYAILDSLGSELLNLTCDNMYNFPKRSWYFWVEADDKTGVYNSDGEMIVPIQYDSVQVTGSYASSSGFRAFRKGEASIYGPDGRLLKLDSRLQQTAKLSFQSEGYFRIYDEEEDIHHYFAPDGKLIASRVIHVGQSHGAARKYGIFTMDGCLFNYTNGVYYCKEE